jgi:hypothetical protein
VNAAAEIIYDLVDPEANLIFGAVIDNSISSGEVSITLIATGFDGGPAMRQQARASVASVSSMAAAAPASSGSSFTGAPAGSTMQAGSRPGAAPVPVEKPPEPQPRIRDDVPEVGIEIPAFLRKRRQRN